MEAELQVAAMRLHEIAAKAFAKQCGNWLLTHSVFAREKIVLVLVLLLVLVLVLVLIVVLVLLLVLILVLVLVCVLVSVLVLV